MPIHATWIATVLNYYTARVLPSCWPHFARDNALLAYNMHLVSDPWALSEGISGNSSSKNYYAVLRLCENLLPQMHQQPRLLVMFRSTISQWDPLLFSGIRHSLIILCNSRSGKVRTVCSSSNDVLFALRNPRIVTRPSGLIFLLVVRWIFDNKCAETASPDSTS
jgi:hypothetical protein